MAVKKTAIIAAIAQYVKNKIELDYDVEEETDEQRQDRHHNENIELQKFHHDEQKLLQKENQEMQEMHFIQQQIIQASISENNYVYTGNDPEKGLYINRHFKDNRIEKYYSLISDKQKQLYNDMMKQTRTREAKEAAEQEAAEKAKRWF